MSGDRAKKDVAMSKKILVVCSGSLAYYIREYANGWRAIWENGLESGTLGVLYAKRADAEAVCFRHVHP
jgi:hypothetical protein